MSAATAVAFGWFFSREGQRFDIVENPANEDFLYLATELGAFRSEDGGNTWVPWNDGWPRATIVTEFVPVFDFEFADFWIYAATWGRSAWRRNLSRTLSVHAPVTEPEEPTGIAAHPNPFRTSTTWASARSPCTTCGAGGCARSPSRADREAGTTSPG
ncbi:MAG: hypothetical protein ACRDGR_01720, partial [bacterium]